MNPTIEITIFQLSPDLYKFDFHHGWGANVLVSVGEDGVLLVDSGYGRTADVLYENIRLLSNSEIKYIINSHAHGDHTGGNRLLAKNGSIIAHRNAVESLSQLRHVIGVGKEYELKFNNDIIRLYASEGGHSLSDIVIHFQKAQVAFLGDMYLSECFPLIGSGDELTVQNLIANLKRCLDILPKETTLVSGHGKDTSMEDLRHYIRMIEQTVDVVVTEMIKGKSLREIKLENVLDKWREWSGNISFITKETWITDIYESYIEQIAENKQIL